MSTQDTAALALHTLGDPAGKPLVMLHGFPEHGAAWADVARALSGWRCVAPDQRGYGQSPAPAAVAQYRISALIGDIAAVIERLGAPLPVVAHDWGAAVAYALTIRRPDLVSALIVINGVHPGPFQRELARGGAQSEASAYIEYLRDPAAEARLSADDFAGLQRLFAAKMNMRWLTGPVLEQYRREWARPGRMTGMLNWYRATPLQVARAGAPLDLPVMPPEAGRIAVPHLVIWGEDDRALLPCCLDGLDAYVPDLEIQRIPGADHWICHQIPVEVAQRIAAWLSRRGF